MRPTVKFSKVVNCNHEFLVAEGCPQLRKLCAFYSFLKVQEQTLEMILKIGMFLLNESNQ